MKSTVEVSLTALEEREVLNWRGEGVLCVVSVGVLVGLISWKW